MADLTQLQQAGGAPAGQLQQVSGITVQEPTALGSMGGLVQSIGSGLMQARGNVQAVKAKQQKDALTEQTNKAVGTMSQKLHDVNKLPVNQRAAARDKIFRNSLQENPALAGDLTKAYKASTGQDPSGKSAAEKAEDEMMAAAIKANRVDSSWSPERQAEGLALYKQEQADYATAQNRLKELELMKAEGELSERVVKKNAVAVAQPLLHNEFKRLTLMKDGLIDFVEENGFSPEAIKEANFKLDRFEAEFRQSLTEQFGPLANDPELQAMWAPSLDIFSNTREYVSGAKNKEAYEMGNNLVQLRAESSFLADPSRQALTAASKLAPESMATGVMAQSMQTELAAWVSEYTPERGNDGRPKSIEIGSDLNEQKITVTATKEALASTDPEKKQQGQDLVAGIAKGLYKDGNGYTDEQKFNAMEIMNQDGAFESLPQNEQFEVTEAASQYMADIADKIVKDVMGKVTSSEQRYTATGNVFYEEATGELGDFFTLELTDKGLTLQPTGAMNASVRKEYVRRNGELAKLDSTLNVLSKGLGISKERVATEVLGIELNQEPSEKGAQTMEGQLSDWWKKTFEEPTMVGDREAQAKALGEKVMEMFDFDPVKSGLIPEEAFIVPPKVKDTGEVGSGTVLAAKEVEEIMGTEGRGDEVTDVPTGSFGVTAGALNATGRAGVDPKSLSDAEAKKVVGEYLQVLDQDFTKNLAGYETLSPKAKEAIRDTAYNIGPSVKNFPSFKAAVARGDEQEAVRQLLDTANEGGKSMKGLAKRRATQYNKVADVKISELEVMSSGQVVYRDADGNEIFSYTPRGGKHPQSSVGVEKL